MSTTILSSSGRRRGEGDQPEGSSFPRGLKQTLVNISASVSLCEGNVHLPQSVIPRYFSRLWCTFEIASFMKDPERRKHIQFMPLKTTVLLMLGSGCWFALAIGWNAFKGHGACIAASCETSIGGFLVRVKFLNPPAKWLVAACNSA